MPPSFPYSVRMYVLVHHPDVGRKVFIRLQPSLSQRQEHQPSTVFGCEVRARIGLVEDSFGTASGKTGAAHCLGRRYHTPFHGSCLAGGWHHGAWNHGAGARLERWIKLMAASLRGLQQARGCGEDAVPLERLHRRVQQAPKSHFTGRRQACAIDDAVKSCQGCYSFTWCAALLRQFSQQCGCAWLDWHTLTWEQKLPAGHAKPCRKAVCDHARKECINSG